MEKKKVIKTVQKLTNKCLLPSVFILKKRYTFFFMIDMIFKIDNLVNKNNFPNNV